MVDRPDHRRDVRPAVRRLSRRGRAAGFLVVLVGVIVATASAASAHASLESSQPDASEVLASSPSEIVLKFDEQVEVSLGGITLLDQQGRTIDVGAPEHVGGDPTRIRAAVPRLANGTYVVAWRVASADSHPAQGSFSFVVVSGENVDANALARQAFGQRDDRVSPLLGVARFAAFIGLAGLIGGIVFVVAVWPVGADGWPARRVLWFAWLLLLFASLAAFALEGPYAAGRGLGHVFDTSSWRAVARTRYGTWLLERFVMIAACGALLVTIRERRHRLWRLAAVADVVLLAFSFSMGGHAGTGRAAGLGVALDVAHLLAMGAWLGGLAMLVVGLRASGEPPAVARFSALALACVSVLVVTGVAQSWRMETDLNDVFSFAWGRAYVSKLVIVIFLVTIAYASRRTVRHFWPNVDGLVRTVGIEVALGAAVLIASTVLTGSAPVAQASAAQPFSTTLVEGNLLADVIVSPTRVGQVGLHVTFRYNTGSLQEIAGADGRLTLRGRDLGALPVKLSKAGPNHFIGDNVQVPFAGTWQLELLADSGASTIRFAVDVKIS